MKHEPEDIYDNDPSWGYDPNKDQEITINWFITKVLIWILVIVLIVSMVSCTPKHYKTTQARYNPYDKDGLLKSSTPLYLDKTKGKRTKSRLK